MMNETFNHFLKDKGFGPAEQTVKVSNQIIESFSGKLPNLLLEMWKEYGWSTYGNGLVRFVNPIEFTKVLTVWLEGTPLENKDTYYVIARSAFGKLFIWGTKLGVSVINCPWGIIAHTDDSKYINKGESDLLIETLLISMKEEKLDFKDKSEKPLFEKAVKTLGALQADEIYGFVPALSLGGSAEIKHLKKVKAIEHLAFLAQTGEKKILS